MKVKVILLMAVGTLLFFSCEKEDTASEDALYQLEENADGRLPRGPVPPPPRPDV